MKREGMRKETEIMNNEPQMNSLHFTGSANIPTNNRYVFKVDNDL